MSLHPANRDRVIEIDEMAYHRLMHELTLAGANERTSYGNGWTGLHPAHGDISVSQVKWPARHPGHPAVAFYVECSSDTTLANMKAALA